MEGGGGGGGGGERVKEMYDYNQSSASHDPPGLSGHFELEPCHTPTAA